MNNKTIIEFGFRIIWRIMKISVGVSVGPIPANFFWDISVRFLSGECWDFWRRHDHFRRFPKVFRRSPKSAEGEVIEKTLIHKIRVLSFIYFTHGFHSLHGSELTYFWKLCQERRQQLTFFNQAWEIGPQAWAGVRSKFSTRRRESWQVYYPSRPTASTDNTLLDLHNSS